MSGEHVVRMPDEPTSYIALRISQDEVRELRVVDGVVVAERLLDEVPDVWPERQQWSAAVSGESGLKQ